jgi:hypothetical protein
MKFWLFFIIFVSPLRCYFPCLLSCMVDDNIFRDSLLCFIYVGRLKSNAHMLVEREQKQIARSGKKYMKVQFQKQIFTFQHSHRKG